MTRKRPALFRGRHFEDAIILLCVRWYLRYSLTYRDLEQIMLERNLSIDHVTIWRWVQRLCTHFESTASAGTPASQSLLAGWTKTYSALRSAQFRRVQVPPALE